MTKNYQQEALIRKFIYAGAILVLFTAALVHRKFILEPQARNLQLSKTSRGQVELTSEAVRHLLTGSRGIAQTYLWSLADKYQQKHEWNKLELIVRSITKLQPYYVMPWLYQSWNLSFNVAVEFDKAYDKYFYISRGIQLLAEGERRNQGLGDETEADAPDRIVFPGNPDMRYFIGFYYQLKIGNSDEKYRMRTLIELSCIDPKLWQTERFLVPSRDGKTTAVNEKTFKEFCANHPRVVRRLRDFRGATTPRLVIDFLDRHRGIPSRFQDPSLTTGDQTPIIENVLEQFPVLPGRPLEGWPDPNQRILSPTEEIDVFALARTWYQYSQLPLPPPDPHPDIDPKYVPDGYRKKKPYDPLRHRLPSKMALILFRAYPARAQEFIGETLQDEGWFDTGWNVNEVTEQKKWFPDDGPVMVGTESRYHSREPFRKAFDMYREYGVNNGLYVSPQRRLELQTLASKYLAITNTPKGADYVPSPSELKRPLPEGVSESDLAEYYFAYRKMKTIPQNLHMTNFGAHYYKLEVEQLPKTVRGRRLLYEAKQELQKGYYTEAFEMYGEAIANWRNLLLMHPHYAKLSEIQEESYEEEFNYLREYHLERKDLGLNDLILDTAKLRAWPLFPKQALVNWVLPNRSVLKDDVKRIMPIRQFRGSMDMLLIYDNEFLNDLRCYLLGVTESVGRPIPLVSPLQFSHTLVVRDFPPRSYGKSWRQLIDPGIVNLVRQRLRFGGVEEAPDPTTAEPMGPQG